MIVKAVGGFIGRSSLPVAFVKDFQADSGKPVDVCLYSICKGTVLVSGGILVPLICSSAWIERGNTFGKHS